MVPTHTPVASLAINTTECLSISSGLTPFAHQAIDKHLKKRLALAPEPDILMPKCPNNHAHMLKNPVLSDVLNKP